MNPARMALMERMQAGIPSAPKPPARITPPMINPLINPLAQNTSPRLEVVRSAPSRIASKPPLVEERQGQLERLAASFKTEAQRHEFGFLFSNLPPKEIREILGLHASGVDPMIQAREGRKSLDALVKARIKDHELEPMGLAFVAKELLESIRMRTKFADADHILVYCLARGAGYKDVRVTDMQPNEGNGKTLYVKEAEVRRIAAEFRDESNTPASVTVKWNVRFSGMLSRKENMLEPERRETAPVALEEAV